MFHAEKCPVCNGEGMVRFYPNHLSASAAIHRTLCHGCDGRGWVTVPKEVQMQDVAIRVDQSCRRCINQTGGPCFYATWSTAYIWLEVEKGLWELANSTDVVCNCNRQRRILNLMWHYGQRVYTVKTLEGPGAEEAE